MSWLDVQMFLWSHIIQGRLDCVSVCYKLNSATCVWWTEFQFHMLITLLLSNERTICTTESSLSKLLEEKKTTSLNNFNCFTTCFYCATTTEDKPETCQTHTRYTEAGRKKESTQNSGRAEAKSST